MRDLDRVHEKIEIRLAPRQVVLLAAGTMLFSGALFAAGFVLGRRQGAQPAARFVADDISRFDAEARAARDAPDAPETPMALGEVEFLFPTVLGSRPARKSPKKSAVRLPAGVVKAQEDAEAARRKQEEGEAAARREAEAAATAARRAEEEATKQRAAEAAAREEADRRAAEEKAEAAERAAEAARLADEARAREAAEEALDEDPLPTALADIPPPPGPGDLDETPEPLDVLDAPEEVGGLGALKGLAAQAARAARSTPEPTPPKPGSAHHYTHQVKASRDKDDAEGFVASLRRAGFEARLVQADIPGKGRYYRVRVGRFDSIEEARAFQRRYKVQSGQADGGFITDL